MLLGSILGFLVHAVLSLNIQASASLEKYVSSPFGSKMIGPRDPSLNLTALAVFEEFGACEASGFDSSAISEKIVLVHNSGPTESLSDDERNVLCLQRAGAVAVVQLSSIPAVVVPR